MTNGESQGWETVSVCMPSGGEYTAQEEKNGKSLGVCLGGIVTGEIEPYINFGISDV